MYDKEFLLTCGYETCTIYMNRGTTQRLNQGVDLIGREYESYLKQIKEANNDELRKFIAEEFLEEALKRQAAAAGTPVPLL
ncbi:MAG TPA: hypothetical protein VF711_10670, partial [Acidimicrobiales bacterium]